MKTACMPGSATLCLLMILGSVAQSQTPWEKYPGNPIIPYHVGGGYALSPTVLFDSSAGIYRMWFGTKIYGGPWSIYLAMSLDGISWFSYVDNPVLEGGSAPFEIDGVGYAAVVHDGVEYKMF